MKIGRIIRGCLVGLTFCFLCNSSVSVNASDGYVCKDGYHTFGDYTLNGGVGNYGYTNRYYWINDNFSDAFKKHIKNAVSEWVYTTDSKGVTTPISIKNTTIRSQSVFDYLKGSLDSGVLGKTTFYKHGGEKLSLNSQGALTQNYSYVYMKIDPSHFSGITDNQRKATCAHELGHAMGLSHNNTKKGSIMCQTAYGRTAERANVNDLNTINHLYK